MTAIPESARERLKAALLARVTFEPPPVPSEWVQDSVYLSRRFAAQPGYLNLGLTPYTVEPLNMLTDPSVRVVTMCCASQVSKSITLVAALSYITANCDGQVVYALPTSEACDWFVQNRWKPIGELSPLVRDQGGFERDNFRIKEQRFKNVTVSWVGSNSANQAAMRSAPFLLLDEVDKMGGATEEEASFYDLILERTKTFPLHKVLEASTPTVQSGSIWRAFLLGDRRHYHVKSPHAPDEPAFVIEFEHLRYDQTARFKNGEWNHNLVRASAYIECPYTGLPIRDVHKPGMLAGGKWIPTNPNADSSRRSYHLSSFYSPWLTFGDVAVAYLKSLGAPEGINNFTNSWLALPRQVSQKMATSETFDRLIAASPSYVLRTVPVAKDFDGKLVKPAMLFMTLDVQDACMYFVVRAYWRHGPSALVDFGMCNTWDDVEKVFATTYPIVDEQGQEWDRTGPCNIGMVDAGFAAKRGANVYGFCAGLITSTGKYGPPRRNWFPSFGRSMKNVSALGAVPVTERGIVYRGVTLNVVFYNDDTWKTDLYVQVLGGDEFVGTWWLPSNLSHVYRSQLSSEALQNAGTEKPEWVETGPNHLGDTEKMQRVLEFKLSPLFRLVSHQPSAAPPVDRA